MRMDSDGEPPTTGGPSFKMPKVPAREKVALRLMDQVAKATRERKKKAMARFVSVPTTSSIANCIRWLVKNLYNKSFITAQQW